MALAALAAWGETADGTTETTSAAMTVEPGTSAATDAVMTSTSTSTDGRDDDGDGRDDAGRRVDGSAVAGLVIDGEPTAAVDPQRLNKPDWKPAPVDFKLGWESYAGQTMTLYFDDVAPAGARIGSDE